MDLAVLPMQPFMTPYDYHLPEETAICPPPPRDAGVLYEQFLSWVDDFHPATSSCSPGALAAACPESSTG